MRERAVRTRREPGGGKRRAQACLTNRLLHSSGQETRPFRFTGRQTFLLERTRPPPMVFTNHETRNTAFFRVLRPSGGEKCRLAPSFSGQCLSARQFSMWPWAEAPLCLGRGFGDRVHRAVDAVGDFGMGIKLSRLGCMARSPMMAGQERTLTETGRRAPQAIAGYGNLSGSENSISSCKAGPVFGGRHPTGVYS